MPGFTLLELLVSMFLFVIVIIVVTSVFLSVLSGQRRAFAERRVLDSLRAGLETMAREMRTGTGFPANCGSGCATLSFTNDEDRVVSYALDSGCVLRTVDSESGCITPRTVSIERFSVIVSGASSGDQRQPRMTLSLGVKARVGREESVFTLSTSVSQRNLDF